MNEIIEIWNGYPLLVSFGAWLMGLSLLNIVALVFIILLYLAVSLTITVNGKESSRPKWIFNIATIGLMYMFPASLGYALIPLLSVIFLMVTNMKLIFWYLNLYLPSNAKVL
jgi:hypothetical protein